MISNEQDAEKLDLELEALTLKWMRRGERPGEVALAFQRQSIVLFMGHGYSPEFLGKIVTMGAEDTRKAIALVAQERINADILTVSKWKDVGDFLEAAE